MPDGYSSYTPFASKWTSTWSRDDNLSMCYLANRHQIFAMNKKWAKYKINCATVSTIGWTDDNYIRSQGISTAEVVKITGTEFKGAELCYDGLAFMYAVGETGKVIAYALSTGKWIVFSNKTYWSPIQGFQLWIEEHDKDTIYCLVNKTNRYIELRYFNIVEKEWSKRNDYNRTFKKLGKECFVFAVV